ncbi:MAG: FAD-binding and (Fe-S)-binding domain-containing protein [Mycobacteriaceae bacterium]
MSYDVAGHRSRLPSVPSALLEELRAAAPGQVHDRATDRLKYAHDASHFLLTPQTVVTPRDAEELAGILRVAGSHGMALTFRSGGTSLSGQSVTAGVMLDTRRHFRDIQVLDDGAKVRVQPGVTVRQVNARLAPFRTKLGPDPASESACTMGGVIANNSSGMLCGTATNTYRTLESLVFVLPSGTVVDSGEVDADERLRHLEPRLYAGLAQLRDELRSSPAELAEIERQYKLKNTMGYGLNSFLDFDQPCEILAHLLVGSEGTLGFVAEATFRTVPIQAAAATAFLILPDLAAANGALAGLIDQQVAAIELLDATSLRVAQRDATAPAALRELKVAGHAALLVEHQDNDETALEEKTQRTEAFLRSLPSPVGTRFSDDPVARASLWHIRKGLYTAVAGARRPGTTALLEDIAVPVPELAGACTDLEGLFAKHGYQESVIFGHAKDGNIHFLISERFDDTHRLRQYEQFTEDLVDLVLSRGGTLKAEHGTGRVMAPFVRRQFGDRLYEAMVRVKQLCDPTELLNPGVIITDDEHAHLRDLKAATAVEEEVDRCVECGYCEPVCPSKDLTTTPRQRIVLRREMVVAEAAGDRSLADELRREYQYDAVDTCAVDGMCQTACPVNINTGDLTRRWRRERSGPIGELVWSQAASHWGRATSVLSSALTTASRLPTPAMERVTAAARRVGGNENIPAWDRALPRGGQRRVPSNPAAAAVVFLPSCTGSLFAPEVGSAGAATAFMSLCQRVGVAVTVPDDIAGLCCGTPWKSKGRAGGYSVMRERVNTALRAVDPTRIQPVIVDASSCTEGLRELLTQDATDAPVHVSDALRFVVETVLPKLTVTRLIPNLITHPTCSSIRSGTSGDLQTIAEAIGDQVHVPTDWGCCAFAGDRGMLHPELTASATHREAQQVIALGADAPASCNRTCELALTRATGKPYVHILELLEEATRPS